ncbi:MAG: nucleotide exchange factor GrpE [Lachnospiraceae bacterium]|nr:nucleotide exchange factor GrpE [Lachnospiraceae bacterium]
MSKKRNRQIRNVQKAAAGAKDRPMKGTEGSDTNAEKIMDPEVTPDEMEETEAETAEGEEKEDKSKISLFSNKKDKKDEKIEELTDQLKRQMAEFDNFRKRTEKEKSTMFDMGARTVVEKFLPIIDNLERGLQAKPADEVTPFTEGIEKVYKQLETVLEGMDVKPIEAVGHEFDPALHNAIMQDEEADVPENTVVEEFQKGYTYKGTVIRYSMVKVRK